MWTSSRGEKKIEARRNELLQKGYELFTERNIESVTMRDVANAVGCGIASVYRYYKSKPVFVIAVATWVWSLEIQKNREKRPHPDLTAMTAEEIFSFFLESFIELYRSRPDLLRFNQFFNIYIRSAKISPEMLKPYQNMIEELKERFHVMYRKAESDRTIRTDEPEEEMFSTILHLMLAAVTRYAIGLVYIPENGFDEEKELEKLKEALLLRYQNGKQVKGETPGSTFCEKT